MTTLSADRLRGLRLIAQLLAPSRARPFPAAPDIHITAAHMLAMQSQNLRAGVTALGLRAGVTDLDVAALEDSGVVRSWSQRGTHHLLAAEDVRWMTRLCTPRVQAASKKRRGGLGLSDRDVDTCRTALLDRLAAAAAPLSRSEAYLVFAEAGVDPDGGRGPHMLRHFGGEGEIIQGPRSTQSAGAEGHPGQGVARTPSSSTTPSCPTPATSPGRTHCASSPSATTARAGPPLSRTWRGGRG